ncbi:LSU ribosomal protein L10P [Ruminococcaceae bacterium KH2T8]|nr:LSU ribosomal protein L10P [Ruminococcaceae bacterium KH2T8]
MPSEKILAAKKQVVADLVESFKGAATFVFASARGLTVEQDTNLRNELRKNDVKYQVVKNTTLRLVFKELGIEGLDELLKGPTAVAFSNDVIAPAKVLSKFAEEYEPLEIKGGIIEGRVADKAEIDALAKVPDKETLYSQVVYGLLFPFTKLAMLVKAVAEKAQEESGVAAEPVAEEAPAAAEAPAEEAAAPAEEAPAAEAEPVTAEAPAEA